MLYNISNGLRTTLASNNVFEGHFQLVKSIYQIIISVIYFWKFRFDSSPDGEYLWNSYRQLYIAMKCRQTGHTYNYYSCRSSNDIGRFDYILIIQCHDLGGRVLSGKHMIDVTKIVRRVTVIRACNCSIEQYIYFTVRNGG